jgi:hypothetical protein
MPSKNALKQLQTDGQLALTIDKLTDLIDKTPERSKKAIELIKLTELNKTNDLSLLVEKLSRDRYAYNRELAAVLIWQLWLYWKFLPYEENRKEYQKRIKAYVSTLKWTIPILEQLIWDKAVGPTELAVIATREMEMASPSIRNKFQQLVLHAMNHRSPSVRLEAVRNMVDLYPFHKEGYVLSGEALAAMIAATYDVDTKVRDWACFSLHNSVETNSPLVEKALSDAFRREDVDSDTYMEAVIGLAKRGYEGEVTVAICKNLTREDCGSGWLDAAEASKSAICLEEVRKMYERLMKKDPADSRLDQIKEVLHI